MSTKRRERRGNRKMRNKSVKRYVIPNKDKDIKEEIDVKAIKHNINYLRKKTKTHEIMTVLKGNAYGHGILEMGKVVRKIGIKYIGVATVGEAILMREGGDKGRILAWLYDIESDELRDAFKLGIDIAIFDETHIRKIEGMVPRGEKINITLFIDTGINRAGIPYEKAKKAFRKVEKSEKFNLIGMMSHLINSQVVNSPLVNMQLYKFRKLREELREMGIVPEMVHIANTDACLNYDVSDFTVQRPGKGIYGISFNNKYKKELRLATTVKSYIIQLKDVDKGQGIGYDWKYIAPRRIRVGVLAIGYADIVPRSSSLKLDVYVRGTKRKVYGLISMDQIVIEARKGDKINDEVIIFGDGKNCPQTIFDVARKANTIPLEVLVNTGNRIERVYRNMEKI